MINLAKKRKNLTSLQVYQAIREYNKRHGFPPSVRELAKLLGVSSPGSVHLHLSRLKKMGWITSEPHKARSITLQKKITAGSHTISVKK